MGSRCGTKHGTEQWINLEPCGLFCGCMTYFLLFYAMYTTSFLVIIPWLGFTLHGLFHLLVFNSICLIAMYSHFKAMCTDPGAVPKEARPLPTDVEENDYEASYDKQNQFKKYCRKCKAFKPHRSHHCSICGRCIVKMDHHCPWVNNCVGVGNHKLFLLFVFWIFVSCMYALILVTAKYIICMTGRHEFCYREPTFHLLVIFLVVESILFGLFTLCMIGDQWTTITSNQTQIDRLKNIKYNYQDEVNEVCGSPAHISFSWSWLVPTPVKFSTPEVQQKVFGYRIEESEEVSPLIKSLSVEPTNAIDTQLVEKSGSREKLIDEHGKSRLLGRKSPVHRKNSGDNSDNDSYGKEESSDWLGGKGPSHSKSVLLQKNEHILINNSSLRHQNDEDLSSENYVRLEMQALNTHGMMSLGSNHRDDERDQVLSTSSVASSTAGPGSGNVIMRKRSTIV